MSSGQELKLLQMFGNDNGWLNSNYEEIQKEHPNEYVAIFNQKIIGDAKNIQTLVEELKSKKIDLSFVLIEFVPEKGLKIIL